MLSIIIPARNEKFLMPTVKDLLEKAGGEIEIIVILDGYWPPKEEIITNERVKYIHFGKAKGMRNGINSGVAIAKGEYIMKIDAHCLLDKHYDLKILADIEDNWVVIPRRKRLDAEKWAIKDVGKPDVDYEYITNPKKDDMHGRIWTQRIIERKDILIDDTPTFQGSCWIMKKDYFHQLELMDEKTYGTFYNEAQEISFKAWLSGGRVVVNKKTWYAHLHKGKKYGRGYSLEGDQRPKARAGVLKWIKNEGWHKQTINFVEMIKYFNMPEWTEEDIKELEKYNKFNKSMVHEPETREQLAEYFKKLGFKVGAEIGVAAGEFTEVLAKQGFTIYAIDAWHPYKGYRDYVSKETLDKLYEQAKKRLKKYNCIIIKKFSSEAVKEFDDESLDFVYIDANHGFAHIAHDIAEWSKKVRKGGIVAGHDYRKFGGSYGKTNQVKDVVDLWAKINNIKLFTTKEKTPSWYYFKK